MVAQLILPLVLFFLTLINAPVYSFISKKDNDTTSTEPKVTIGLGAGLNYGGFGVQGGFQPIPYIRAIAGYGTNLIDMNYNLGLQFRLRPNKRFCPTISYMYGYNAAIFNKEFTEQSKSFDGSTLGAGIEFWNQKKSKALFFQVFLPIRSIAYENSSLTSDATLFYNTLNSNPILLSIGVHFGIR
ncbi:MAG: hypothetical protein EAZ07_02660 [Cytophagales bacterium]|nr:MAG: hypothetical protein EAZ07_02660 [Cytophagales bacterium]